MTARMLLSNLASFSVQIAVVVAAGGALARAFRIDDPNALLASWRTILLACLALPLLQPWTEIVPPALGDAVAVVDEGRAVAGGDVVVGAAAPSTPWLTADVVLMVLAAGLAARALWLTIGAFALRRLRQHAVPLDPIPEPIRRAQERIGARARLFVSDRVAGPITFGLFRPIVLFPPGVNTMPAHVQEAIAYHELLHVRRRDWLYEIVEEAVRTALWFHPAVWWLIGRIRLTREQVVDRAVIALTNSRERYVAALLAVASTASAAEFAPASPFFRRHLLKRRVARILQETTMTTRRLIASLTACAAAITVAATFAVRSFPLQAQGTAPADTGAPIQIVQGGEHLMHGETPEYPHRAIEQKIEGDVVVDLTLDAVGEVSDARVLSGPEELRKATLAAVLGWHFSPAAINSTVTQATLRFTLPVERDLGVIAGKQPPSEEVAVYTLTSKLRSAALETEHVAGPLREIEKAITDPSTTDEQRVELRDKYEQMTLMAEKIRADGEPLEVEFLDEDHSKTLTYYAKLVDSTKDLQKTLAGSPRLLRITAERVSEATASDVLAQAGIAIGDAMTEEAAKRLSAAARTIDAHLHVEFERTTEGLIVTILPR
jgi:TonB family protein